MDSSGSVTRLIEQLQVRRPGSAPRTQPSRCWSAASRAPLCWTWPGITSTTGCSTAKMRRTSSRGRLPSYLLPAAHGNFDLTGRDDTLEATGDRDAA